MEVNIHEAKTHLSRLLQRVAAGEEITIARAGTPVARLVAVEPQKNKVRPLGMDRGRVWIADDFNAPRLISAFNHPSNPWAQEKATPASGRLLWNSSNNYAAVVAGSGICMGSSKLPP